MPLIKCPDCGKLVSSRAAACPVCGCPSSYFGIDESKTDDKLYESDNFEDKNEDEILETFSILNKNIVFPKNTESYISAVRFHNNTAALMEIELRKMYKEAKEMDKVWSTVIPNIEYTINKLVKEDIEILYKSDIIISEDNFKRKYGINLQSYIQDITDAYNEVVADANSLQEARQYERAGRSRWQGGGFGIKGAIKGAVKAGAMNAITNAGRAIGDSLVNSSDRTAIMNAKQAIYNNEKYQDKIFIGFRMCISHADLGLAEELAEAGLTKRIEIDFNKAEQLFVSAVQYEKDKKRLASKAIECVSLYPFNMAFYKPILYSTIINEDDMDELLRFMKFWKMDKDFSNIFAEEEKRGKVKEYLTKNPEVKNVNFNDYRPETYIKLRSIRKDLIQTLGNCELPEMDPFCISLVTFFEECLNRGHCLDSIEILRDIDENSSFLDYLMAIHNEKIELPGLLKNIWILGDSDKIPEEKLKNKWELPVTDTICMYQNTAIWGTVFGGEGFVLTNSVLCELKSRQIIQLKQITDITYSEQDRKIYITDGSRQITINVESEKLATRWFIYECLENFVERYAKLSSNEKHVLALRKIAIKMQEITATYARQNNIEDADGLLEEFLINRGLMKPRPETIFCPFCGKQIVRTTKFCNFCGKKNNYGN